MIANTSSTAVGAHAGGGGRINEEVRSKEEDERSDVAQEKFESHVKAAKIFMKRECKVVLECVCVSL